MLNIDENTTCDRLKKQQFRTNIALTTTFHQVQLRCSSLHGEDAGQSDRFIHCVFFAWEGAIDQKVRTKQAMSYHQQSALFGEVSFMSAATEAANYLPISPNLNTAQSTQR